MMREKFAFPHTRKERMEVEMTVANTTTIEDDKNIPNRGIGIALDAPLDGFTVLLPIVGDGTAPAVNVSAFEDNCANPTEGGLNL